jgi:alkanesulfonate monooxygenase SsuD/methylene tetrahydromethanopterin reductase-like flavin-dependent oxidoreductase (luciferase family)
VLVPPARPDLPILIAAKRSRMLELTARHADIWNEAWFGPPDERWSQLRVDLDAACRAVGRDPASLERSVGVSVRFAGASDEPALSGDAAEIAAGIRAYAADGTSHLIAALQPKTPEAVDRFAEAARLARA